MDFLYAFVNHCDVVKLHFFIYKLIPATFYWDLKEGYILTYFYCYIFYYYVP